MASLEARTIIAADQYGPLQAGFQWDLRWGYTALVGPNNAGKSAILHLVFRYLAGEDAFGPSRLALILTDRQYVRPSTQVGTRTLDQWNQDMLASLSGTPVNHAEGPSGPQRSELPWLLAHGSFMGQVAAMNDLLPRFGLPPFDLVGAQEVRFENIAATFQGSGLRGLLPILAALTNPNVTTILIDEPEMALEPRLQKVLRDVLVADAEHEKLIVVSTHSHLFLNRTQIESNQLVTRAEGLTKVRTLTRPQQLYDITFDLLGSSTEDLFFPGNYIIVEGASDQVIVMKALTLLDAPPPTVKVLAARGIDAVRDTVMSVARALVPLMVNDSPYATRVVALIDQPPQPEPANVTKLRGDLDEDRLYILDVASIEEYIPDDVYQRAGRSKDEAIEQLARAGDRVARDALKKEISNALAAVLTHEDLDGIPIVRDTARRAIDESR